MEEFLAAPALAPYKLLLTRILRYKPHTLGEKEEKLLAMQTEMAEAAGQIFRQLNDADLKFGTVKNEKGQPIELSHGTFIALLHSPDRDVRCHGLPHLLRAVHGPRAHAGGRAERRRSSATSTMPRPATTRRPWRRPCFPTRCRLSVYDNLIASVHRQLPALHHYYDVRRRKMQLKDIHHYDTYVPILADMQSRHTWDEAVKVVLAALEPLGSEYGGVLAARAARPLVRPLREPRQAERGLLAPARYDGNPYILMNYQPDVLDHVFTLAHEAGHSMHSYFSAKNQPYAYYNYSIFVAEVASTFNEQLSEQVSPGARRATSRSGPSC